MNGSVIHGLKFAAVLAILVMAMAVCTVSDRDTEVSALGTSTSPASSLSMDVVEFGINPTGLTMLENAGVTSTVTTHYLYVGSSVEIYAWNTGDSYGYCPYSVLSGYGLSCSNGCVSGTITKAGTITFTAGSYADTELSSISNSMSKIVAVAEEDPDVPVSSISLSFSTTSTGFKVTASTSPSSASYSAVAFSVQCNTLDPVKSQSGKVLTVTPSASGTYTITCGAKDGYGASATMTVYVSEIDFDANGGTGAPSSQFVCSTSSSSHAHVLPDTVPTHQVNTFAGWATTSTGSAVYQPGDTVTVGASGFKYLYAAWNTPTEVTITPGSAGETMLLTANVNTSSSDKSVTWSYTQYTSNVSLKDATDTTVTVADAGGGYFTVVATANDGTGATATVTLYATTISFLHGADSGGLKHLVWISTTSEPHTFILPDSSSMKKAGYIFAGWATTSGADTATYIDGDSVVVSGGTYKYLYGVWDPEPVICTITFDANGGSGTVATQHVQAGNTMTLPTRGFSKENAVLIYWGLSPSGAAGIYEIGETYEVKEDVTFYAIYTNVIEMADNNAPQTVEVGQYYEYVPFTSNPSGDSVYSSYQVFWAVTTKGSFSFVVDTCPAWMEIDFDYNLKNGLTISGTPAEDDVGVFHVSFHIEETGVTNADLLELVASSYVDWWVTVTEKTPTYWTVTFNANGGAGSQQSLEQVIDGNAIVLPGTNDLGYSKTGYTQVGWSTLDSSNNRVMYSLGSAFTVRSNTIFRAEWQADTNLVIYDANGGVSTAKQYDIASTDGTVSLPSSGLVKSGARFAGWYVGTVNDGIYAPGMEVSVTGQVHYMAYWIPSGSQTSTVTFNANGGAGSLKVELVKGHSCVLPEYGFTGGTGLIGWSVSSAGDDAMMPLSLYPADATITLYAVYGKDAAEIVTRFTVVFSTNGGSGSYIPLTVTAGDTIDMPSKVPTLAAHAFVGWKVEGGGMWDFSDPVNASMTLVAMWDQHFSVIYDGGLKVTVEMAGAYAGMNTRIDWGDGNSQDTNSASVSHTYAAPMTGTITVFSNGLSSTVSSATAFSVSADDDVELKAVGKVTRDGDVWILDASGSTGVVSLVWYLDGTRVGDTTEVRLSGLTDGTHDVVLTVMDADNNSDDWSDQITMGGSSNDFPMTAAAVIIVSAILGILALTRIGPPGLLIILIGAVAGYLLM